MDAGLFVTPRVAGSDPLHKLSDVIVVRHASAPNSSPVRGLWIKTLDRITDQTRLAASWPVVVATSCCGSSWIAFGGKSGHGVGKLGLEGMVSKKLSASSRSGPPRSWIKV